jgi:hypothetical protein
MNEISHGIRRLCQMIRLGGAVFVLGVLAIYFVTWLWPGVNQLHHPVMPKFQLSGLDIQTLSSLLIGERLLLSAISVPYLVVLAWAFYRLDQMLRGFMLGEFFERETVGHLRAFAGLLLLAKLLSLAALHVRVAVFAHVLGRHDGRAVVNLSSDDMAVLLMCALFFLIARMMEEGRRIAEENKGFV